MIATFISRWIAPFWLPIAIAAAIVGWGLAVTFKLQIEGLKVWPINIVGWRDENATLKLDLDNIKDASEMAALKQKAQRDADQATFNEAAKRTETEHAKELSQARSATARFITARRLRPEAAQGLSRRADQAGQGPSAGLPADAPSGSELVAVEQRDVETAAENYIYAKKARDWAADLIAKGLAEPAE